MNETQGMVKAAGQIGLYTLLSRVTGLVRDIIIGTVFGAGAATDSFFVAFRIPNLLRRVVGEGAAVAAVVPVITAYLSRRSRPETMEMIRALIGVGLVVLMLLTAVGMVWAAPLAHLFAPGFSPAQLALTTRQLRIMFPYLFFIGLVALAMGILHALRHFAAPAFAPVLLNLMIIFSALVVWLGGTPVPPIFILAYGVVIGGLCQFLWQLPMLRRLGVPLVPRWNPWHPAIRQMVTLLAPVLLGAAVYQLSVLLNSLLASLLAEGSVSALWYANRLFEFPQGIFVVALSSAALPSLATQAQGRDFHGLSESLGFALRLINFVVLPAAFGLTILAVPICAVLFFHGAFGVSHVMATAATLQGFAVGLWSVAVGRLLSACLYALQDTRSPMVTGGVALLVNVGLSLMLMGKISASGPTHGLAGFFAALSESLTVWNLGPAGLALAASLAATVNLVLLGVVLVRRLGTFPWTTWFASLAWSLAASVVMSGPVWWIAHQIEWLDKSVPLPVRLFVLTAAIAGGAVSFAVVAWPGGKAELRALASMLPQRLLRFLPQFLQSRG